MKKSLLLLSVLLSQQFTFSQTGPAGVQTSASNVFWVKADAGTSSTVNLTSISAWNDQSGNGINTSQPTANQQPSFATNVINGYPAILFDNTSTTNDRLSALDNSILDNTSGYTFFFVTRPGVVDNNARCLISKRTSVGVDQSFMHFFFTGSSFYSDIQTNNDRYNTTYTFSANNNYLITQQYDGTLATASRCRTYVSGSLNITDSETSATVLDNASNLLIGSTDPGDGRPFGGHIAEIIIYRTALTTAPRIIVENYLSAKYNISNTNDRYAGDNGGNGDYDRDVAGVGQESTGSSISFSPSACAGLGIAVNSGLNDGDYIMAGHTTSVNTVITTDVGGYAGTNRSRWNRIWYIDVTNTSTSLNTNINFDFSAAGLTAPILGWPADYVLLYRAGTSGNWTQVSTATSISGDNINFNNITLTNDGYYTLGTKNYFASPLPLDLISFDALAKGDDVELKWKTATEKNTSYFIIQRSTDAVNFEKVDSITAKGTTEGYTNYTSHDQLTQNITYYQLSSFDLDGTSKTFPMIAVFQTEDFILNVFPNPAENSLNIKINSPQPIAYKFELLDNTGKIVSEITSNSKTTSNLQTIDVSQLPRGAYLYRLTTPNQTLSNKIILK